LMFERLVVCVVVDNVIAVFWSKSIFGNFSWCDEPNWGCAIDDGNGGSGCL
jgi:hypothetical protein